MGKNKDRESLIRTAVNTVVHQIVVAHTNKPESKQFLSSEVIEYRSQTEKRAETYNWNKEDLTYIKEKSIKQIKEKLDTKYQDVKYSETEIKENLNKLIEQIIVYNKNLN